jgi:hypothetical protein
MTIPIVSMFWIGVGRDVHIGRRCDHVLYGSISFGLFSMYFSHTWREEYDPRCRYPNFWTSFQRTVSDL